MCRCADCTSMPWAAFAASPIPARTRPCDASDMERTELKITPTEAVEVQHSDSGRLTVQVTYAPGGDPPPAHFHPAQDERFEVLAGELQVKIGDDKRVLGPGDTLEVPRGTVHSMWNRG